MTTNLGAEIYDLRPGIEKNMSNQLELKNEKFFIVNLQN
jgi:hypothetical protein